MEEKQYAKAHKLLLNNRRTGTVSGVTDVISFDIAEILLETEQGMLTIKGADLHVNRLTLEKGEVDIEGRIDSMAYSEVTDFFSVADVTVLPYRSATQSGISSVSYHFEVPMIVTAVGGLKETIGDAGTGLVAEECTPEAIRAEIGRYFSDPSIREGCITAIRREKERLSWGAFCRKLIGFAGSLNDSSGRNRA